MIFSPVEVSSPQAPLLEEKKWDGRESGCPIEPGEADYQPWGSPSRPGLGGGISSGDIGIERGTGSGGSRETISNVPTVPIKKVVVPYKILSKPRPSYTYDARVCNYQGSMRLKVTLLASRNIGSVVPLTRLPYGLTEQAVAAARQIRFEPKKVNGVPVSITVTMEYRFTNY